MNRATLVSQEDSEGSSQGGKELDPKEDLAGGKHEIWVCGTTEVVIPRHREINEYTAEGIMKYLETELGEDWWR